MQRIIAKTILLIVSISLSFTLLAQQDSIKGVVYDKGRINRVELAKVMTTAGQFAYTDTMGRYAITAKDGDSIYFIFNNRSTQKYAVSKIMSPLQFDIALNIAIDTRFPTLKEVVIYSKTHRQDSIENRETYAKYFDYKKPGLSTSVSPTGGVGADVNELINMFRFKHNKRMKAFQQRLEEQEKERYIKYRFNKVMITKTTGLIGEQLDSFVVKFSPPYNFVVNASETQLVEYTLRAFEQFKRLGYMLPTKKDE